MSLWRSTFRILYLYTIETFLIASALACTTSSDGSRVVYPGCGTQGGPSHDPSNTILLIWYQSLGLGQGLLELTPDSGYVGSVRTRLTDHGGTDPSGLRTLDPGLRILEYLRLALFDKAIESYEYPF